MSKFSTKVYITQKVDDQGRLAEVLAARLTFEAAHTIAKAHAPCKVILMLANKALTLDETDHIGAGR